MLARHERKQRGGWARVRPCVRFLLEAGAVVVALWQTDLVTEAAAVAVVETAVVDALRRARTGNQGEI